jgi:hypothetical protein
MRQSLIPKLKFEIRKLSALSYQLLFQVMNDLSNVRVHFHPALYQTAGVQNGSVIAAAEGLANRVQRAFGHLPGQKHRDLPGERNILGPASARHVSQPDIIMFGDFFLNHIDTDREAPLFVEHFPEQVFRGFDRKFVTRQRNVGGNPDQGSFEPADIRSDATCQEIEDLVREVHAQ